MDVTTSREVNEARRPHTCSRPCAFEQKKQKEKRNPAAPETHPLENAFFKVLETPYGPATRSRYEHQSRYVGHDDCATRRAATRLFAGIEDVRTHASISLLRTSAGVFSGE